MAQAKGKYSGEILNYIRSYNAQTGCMPSYREIGAAVGLHSTSTVSYYVSALKREGILVSNEAGRIQMVHSGDIHRAKKVSREAQRFCLRLADGGEVRLDCYLSGVKSDGTPRIVFDGVLEASKIKGRVARIVSCDVEQAT